MKTHAPRSSTIRKGSMKQDEITRVAKELTWCKHLDPVSSTIRAYKAIVEKKAPKVEPVEHGSYEVYAAYIKAQCKVHDTYTVKVSELTKMFPQNKEVSDIARNLERWHWISHRRIWNLYTLYVEPTREELIVQLTSAENECIRLQKKLDKVSDCWDEASRLLDENIELKKDVVTFRILNWWLVLMSIIILGQVYITYYR